MPINKKLVDNILRKMKDAGIQKENVTELSRRSGVGRITLSRIMNRSQKTVTLDTLASIADGLNCSVSDLVEGL